MIRRLFWLGTGASLGLGGAMWVRRRVRRAVTRYVPARVGRDVAGSMRRVGTDLKDAWSEGRAEMRSREAELRRDLAPGERPG